MPKILKRRIRWGASQSSDVVGHRVYWSPAGTPIDYATTPSKLFPADVAQAVIPDDIPELGGADGEFQVGVSAVDDIGNESDVAVVETTFDFQAPDAPTDVVVEGFF